VAVPNSARRRCSNPLRGSRRVLRHSSPDRRGPSLDRAPILFLIRRVTVQRLLLRNRCRGRRSPMNRRWRPPPRFSSHGSCQALRFSSAIKAMSQTIGSQPFHENRGSRSGHDDLGLAAPGTLNASLPESRANERSRRETPLGHQPIRGSMYSGVVVFWRWTDPKSPRPHSELSHPKPSPCTTIGRR
jgi:hypothetical protein